MVAPVVGPEGLRWEGDLGGCLLLSGERGDPAAVAALGDFLAGRGHYVLAPALPALPFDRYRWRRAGELALFELQGLARPVTVVGTGLGGTLALDLALRYPVKAVVALSPRLAETPSGFWSRLGAALGPGGKPVREFRAYLKTLLPRLADLRVPTLLLRGEAEVVWPGRPGRVTLEVLPGRGEILALSPGDELLGQIENFLWPEDESDPKRLGEVVGCD